MITVEEREFLRSCIEDNGYKLIPIKAGAKDCILPAWQHSNETAESIITSALKGRNVGIVCGKASGIVVIDLDNKDQRDGLFWLRANDDRIDSPIYQNTPSGGKHLFFKYPENAVIPSSRDRIAPGVEIKSDGTYVLIAPSKTTDGVYKFGDLDISAGWELPELPEWLIQEIQTNVSKQLKAYTALKSPLGTLPEGIQQKVSDLAYQGAVNKFGRIDQGGRNSKLYSVAQHFLDLGLTGYVLAESVKRYNNEYCAPPLPEDEIDRTILSSDRTYARQKPIGADLAQLRVGRQPLASVSGNTVSVAEVLPAEAAVQQVQVEHASGNRQKPYKKQGYCADVIISTYENLTFFQGDFYCFDNTLNHYRKVEPLWVEGLILETLTESYPDAAGDFSSNFVTGVRRLIASQMLIKGVSPKEINSWLRNSPEDGDYVAMQNGAYNVKTDNFFPWSAEVRIEDFFCLTVLPFSYDPNAECFGWEELLAYIWDGDEQKALSLQQWFGYCLTRETRAQKFAIFHGEPASGKSTIANVLMTLLGKGATASGTISSISGNFGLEGLPEKRLLIINEANNAKSNVDSNEFVNRLKEMTGEDQLIVNRKNKVPVYTKATWKTLVISNCYPHFLRDESRGVMSRCLAFYFGKGHDRQANPNLLQELLEELPGIFNWAIKGKQHWVKTNLIVNPMNTEEIEDFNLTSHPEWEVFDNFLRVYPANTPEGEQTYGLTLGKVRNLVADYLEHNYQERVAENWKMMRLETVGTALKVWAQKRHNAKLRLKQVRAGDSWHTRIRAIVGMSWEPYGINPPDDPAPHYTD